MMKPPASASRAWRPRAGARRRGSGRGPGARAAAGAAGAARLARCAASRSVEQGQHDADARVAERAWRAGPCSSATPCRSAQPEHEPGRAAPTRPRAGRRTTLYQPKTRTVEPERTVPGSSACSIGAKGPASWPFGLSVPSTAPARSSQRLCGQREQHAAERDERRRRRHDARRADARRDGREQHRESASSTIVAVKTAPICAARRPRLGKVRARITDSQPNANERSARATNISRPSAVRATRARGRVSSLLCSGIGPRARGASPARLSRGAPRGRRPGYQRRTRPVSTWTKSGMR